MRYGKRREVALELRHEDKLAASERKRHEMRKMLEARAAKWDEAAKASDERARELHEQKERKS